MVKVVCNPEMWDLILKMEGLQVQGTGHKSSSPLHPRKAECGAWRGGGVRTDLILPGRAARVSCCRVVVVTSSQTLPSPRVQPSSESTETPASLPTHLLLSIPLLPPCTFTQFFLNIEPLLSCLEVQGVGPADQSSLVQTKFDPFPLICWFTTSVPQLQRNVL